MSSVSQRDFHPHPPGTEPAVLEVSKGPEAQGAEETLSSEGSRVGAGAVPPEPPPPPGPEAGGGAPGGGAGSDPVGQPHQ